MSLFFCGTAFNNFEVLETTFIIGNSLQLEQESLAPQTSAIAAKTAIAGYNAMTRYDNCQRILMIGIADST